LKEQLAKLNGTSSTTFFGGASAGVVKLWGETFLISGDSKINLALHFSFSIFQLSFSLFKNYF